MTHGSTAAHQRYWATYATGAQTAADTTAPAITSGVAGNSAITGAITITGPDFQAGYLGPYPHGSTATFTCNAGFGVLEHSHNNPAVGLFLPSGVNQRTCFFVVWIAVAIVAVPSGLLTGWRETKLITGLLRFQSFHQHH